MKGRAKEAATYVAVLSLTCIAAITAGLTSFANQIDNDAYDWMFRAFPPSPWTPRSILLTVDEHTLVELGGMRNLRRFVAEALETIASAQPRLVANDITLADAADPADDAALESAFAKLSNLILPSDMMPDARSWQEPLPRFRTYARAIGHVHAAPDKLDSVNRAIPLEMVAARDRRWALALEAYRLYTGTPYILESPTDLTVGSTTVPCRRPGRHIRIRYLPPKPDGTPAIPRISVLELKRNPGLAEKFRDRVVFVGVTAQTLARDRLMTPYSSEQPMPGVEIHAHAFETLAEQRFLTDAPAWAMLGFCILLAAATGFIFWKLSGWASYLSGAVVLATAHVVPNLAFRWGIVFPVFAPLSAAWLCMVTAASWQHFVVRRQLLKTEQDKVRYQQAIHFVTHEMRTPLTAIQGSSELIERFDLNEDKRRQLANVINSESKRLARMIQTFLDVERLSAGQMELKQEEFPIKSLLTACLDRARPLAERKQMQIHLDAADDLLLQGDRELMEYAVYNLLTNAIKYSPVETEITVKVAADAHSCRLSVVDQGMGMDEKELKSIFQKFYRTRKAVASGEAGTGIGLSIVDQIVTAHGGRVEVTSKPGVGSCFTIVIPVVTTRNAYRQSA